MTVESTEGVVEDVVVQTPEQAAQAFAEGFEDDEQTPTPASPEKTETEQPAAEPEPKEAKEPEPPKLAQITEAQFNELMAKANQFDESRRQIDTLSGHIGGLKQVIEGIKQQRKTLAPGQLKRLGAEFPELAQALQEDLSDFAAVPAAIDPEEVGRRVKAEIEPLKQEVQIEILSLRHSDWQEVTSSTEFQQWKATLPQDTRTALDNSWDARFIAGKLTEFKAAKAAKDEAARKAAEASKRQQTDTRQKRLEAAVQPRGTGGSASNTKAVDDFSAGWDSA